MLVPRGSNPWMVEEKHIRQRSIGSIQAQLIIILSQHRTWMLIDRINSIKIYLIWIGEIWRSSVPECNATHEDHYGNIYGYDYPWAHGDCARTPGVDVH